MNTFNLVQNIPTSKANIQPTVFCHFATP